jgi:hypothetical protein
MTTLIYILLSSIYWLTAIFARIYGITKVENLFSYVHFKMVRVVINMEVNGYQNNGRMPEL